MSPFTSLSARRGFTLIELIAVIVILAVLAVVAVPMMLDLRTDARNAMARNAAVALRAGVDNARLRWRISGGGVAVTDLSGWGDGTADFSADGFLMGANYAGGALTSNNCVEIWRAALGGSPTISTALTAGNAFAGAKLFNFCTYYVLDSAGGLVTPYIVIYYDPLDYLATGSKGLISFTDSTGGGMNLPAAN